MTGRRVFWYFVAFFGFIATVDAVMVTLAVRTHSGKVTEHPYETGLAYNQVVEAEKKQEELGWRGKIDYDKNMLKFSLHDKNNNPLTLDKATATITRPTQSGMDFTLELKSGAAPVNFPAKGLWEVRVDAVHTGIPYQQAQRIVVE